MLKTIFLLIFTCSSLIIVAQVKDSSAVIEKDEIIEEQIFYMCEDPPRFPGGDEARNKYLIENIIYPKQELDSNIQGVVIVSFIVEKDGSISHVKILKSVSENIDQVALQVVGKMPKWTPGKQRGKPVRVYVNLPIRFTLN